MSEKIVKYNNLLKELKSIQEDILFLKEIVVSLVEDPTLKTIFSNLMDYYNETHWRIVKMCGIVMDCIYENELFEEDLKNG